MIMEDTNNTRKQANESPLFRVVHVTVTPEGRTEHELTGKELEEWKKSHGIDVNDGEGKK